jgi:hypothetical protein
MTTNELKNKAKAIERRLNSQLFSREKDSEDLENEKNNLESIKTNKIIYDKASLLLRAQAAETREATIGTIEEMISQALQSIYGFDYGFSFKYNEKAIEKGERGAFNITPSVTSGLGDNKITTSISARGGGLKEVISVLLRLAFLKFYNYKGTIVLDETWASLSADTKMDNLIEFMDHYIKETDIQIIFITHRAEMFGKIANKIICVSKDSSSSESSVAEMNYDDMLYM